MKINSMLLASAATLMASSVAFAADLPSKKAAPSAGSVQVCKVAGNTGFTLPGSDTCVVLSGYVWAQTVMSRTDGVTKTAGEDMYSSAARGQLNIDSYSNTEMGVLAAHIGIRGDLNPNTQRYNMQMAAAGGDFSTKYSGATNSFSLNTAYLQLGGFIAGKLDSKFSAMDGGNALYGYNDLSPSTTPLMIGYSASAGNATFGIYAEQSRATASKKDLAYGLQGGNATSYSGLHMPDIVGTLDFDVSNVDLHLAAAYHDISMTDPMDTSADLSASGYGLDAALKFKLDSMGKGSYFQAEGSYADGAVDRLAGVGSWDLPNAYDVSYDVAGDHTYASGFSYGAQLHLVMNPKMALNVYGAYQSIDVNQGFSDGDSDSVYFSNSGVSSVRQTGKWNESAFTVGANVDWEPVKNFHVKPEINYISSNNVVGVDVASSEVTFHRETTATTVGLLRIQRDF